MKDRFATDAYGRFLLWGIPAALGSAISTLIDATLVGNYIGNAGLAAINIATPLFTFFAFWGVTLAVGANVIIGREIGLSEIQSARLHFRRLLGCGLIVSLICFLGGVLFTDPLLVFLGANEETMELAGDYATIVLFCGALFIFYHLLSYSVRSDGDPKTAATASGTLIVLNMALDIFFLGVLEMGIFGASLALCLATLCADLVLLTHFRKKEANLKLGFSMPDWQCAARFLQNGFGVGSAFLFQAVTVTVFNTLLSGSGAQGTFYVAYFGIQYTMSTFAFALFDGASAALTPIVAMFSGEKDINSIRSVLRKGIRTVLGFGLLALFVYGIGAPWIVSLFGISDAAQKAAAAEAFRLYAVGLVFAGINVMLTSWWQSIGRARLSGVMSVLENLVVLLVAGCLLIPHGGIRGLALSYLCCEAFCLLVGVMVALFSNTLRRLETDYSSVSRTYERIYDISTQSIESLAGDLELVGEEWALDRKKLLFINLISEEVILNIIKFALVSEKRKHYIAIKLIESDGDYIMRIRDDVAGYNPFDNEGGDDVDNAVLRMIRKKSKECSYQRKLVFNYLYLVL